MTPPSTLVPETESAVIAAPSEPKLSFAKTSTLVIPLSCSTETASATAVGVSISNTVTVTSALDASPLESVRI